MILHVPLFFTRANLQKTLVSQRVYAGYFYKVFVKNLYPVYANFRALLHEKRKTFIFAEAYKKSDTKFFIIINIINWQL